MGWNFIILAFSLVGPVYCTLEPFMKSTNGKGYMKCDPNSICVMNNTNHLDGKGTSFCATGGSYSNVSYVCLKGAFQKSKCTTLPHQMEIDHSGCYKGRKGIKFFFNWNKYPHSFVLHGSLQQYHRESGQWSHVPAFSYFNFPPNRWVRMKEDSWILVKLSNNTVEDFGEFFMNNNPEPPTDENEKDKEEGKEEEKESEKGILSKLIPILYKEEEKESEKGNEIIVWIILGGVGILLLIVFPVVAFVLYRRKLQNKKEGNETTTNTIPLETTVPPTQDQEFNDDGTYSDLYGIYVNAY